MITSEKLAIYRQFDGDEDGWSRAGCPQSRILEDGDWAAIRFLVQEITMLKRNLVSADYGIQIRKKLAETTSNETTAQELFNMA